MKKTVSILLSVLLVFAIAASTMAVTIQSTTPNGSVTTGSVTQVGLPRAVMTTVNGQSYEAVINSNSGTRYVPDDGLNLVVTPYSEAGNAIPAINKLLTDANADIQKAASVSKLSPEMVKALSDYQATLTDPFLKSIKLDDLVVTALFDVSLVRNGELIHLDKTKNETITFKLQTNFKEGDFVFILINCGEPEWNVVKQWTVGKDGVVTMTLDTLCPFVFLAPKEGLKDNTTKPGTQDTTKPNAPTSPQTGEELPFTTIGVVCIVATASLVTLIYRRKKHNA